MNLYFLRHGIAAEHDSKQFPDDTKRPLTPEGRKKLRRSANGLLALGLGFDLIFTSPYVRARQTADIVAEVFKAKAELHVTPHLAHAGDTHALVTALNGVCKPDDNVLLVGHEPDMSQFIALLLTGSSNCEMDLKKGGLCKLEVARLRHDRCATLRLFLTPKVMMRLS